MDARECRGWRILEGPRVRELSPEIEAAQEAEDLAEGGSGLATNPLRQREIGPRVEEKGGTLSAAARWREKKNPGFAHGAMGEQLFRRDDRQRRERAWIVRIGEGE